MKIKIITAILVIGFIISCSKNNGEEQPVDCTTISKTFSVDVSPIISSRCAITGCHASNSVNGPGPLTTYTQIFNARAQIRDAVATGRMPQNGPLTELQKNTITCWIDSGAPNN